MGTGRVQRAAVGIGQVATNLFPVGSVGSKLKRVHDCSHFDVVDLIRQSSVVHDPLTITGCETV